MSPPIFGISSYAFPWAVGVGNSTPARPMSARHLLDAAIELEAGRLQLADNMPVHKLPAGEWNALVRAAQNADIQIELGIRGLTPENISTYLPLCADCASPFLRVVIDADGYEPDTDAIIQIIKAALPRFREQGVVLAIENHDRFRAGELVEIIRATDEDWVGICLDTANSLGADEGIYEVTEVLAPHTVNLHVKDYAISRFPHAMGFEVTGRPAGQGQTPISWILEKLSAYGKCQSATLEVWSMPLETLEETIEQERAWAKAGANYLKNILDARMLSKPTPENLTV